jgi:tetratricopeptide (TPR) repeat protein
VVASAHINSLLHLRLVLDELLITAQYDTLDLELGRLLTPVTLGDFIPLVLVRLEETFNAAIPMADTCSAHAVSRGLVGTLLSYIAASRHGITEHELLSCLGLQQTAVATLFRSLGEYVHSDTGLIMFAHDIFVQAVSERYMGDEPAQQQVHRELAVYFHTLSVDDDRRYEELPWHYQGAAMLDELEVMLSDLATFQVMRSSNEFRQLELAAYWRLLGLDKAQPAYRAQLEAQLKTDDCMTQDHVGTAVAVAKALHEWGDYAGADEVFALAEAWIATLQSQGEAHASLHASILEAQARLAMHRSKSQRAVDLFEQAIGLYTSELAALPAMTDLCWAKIMVRDLAGDKGAIQLLKQLLLQHVSACLKQHNATAPTKGDGVSTAAWRTIFKLLELPSAVDDVAPMTASTLNRLALALSNQGFFNTAERLFTVSLTLHENIYGRTHPHVALVLNDLATVLLRQVQADHVVTQQTEPYLYLAEAGRLPTDGLALADDQSATNDQVLMASAEAHYRRGLAIRRGQLGQMHPFTATSMMGLADLLLRSGQVDGARQLYQEAWQVRNAVLGPDNPQTLIAEQRLTLC